MLQTLSESIRGLIDAANQLQEDAPPRSQLDEIVAGFVAGRTLEENLAHFGAAGVTVGPICDPSDLISHEFIRGRGVVEDFPDEDHGTIPLHGIYPRLSETPGAIRSPAPKLGEHTDEILELLGCTESDQSKLREGGIV